MDAGGDLAPVEDLLAQDVIWHVPGTSPIAGEYRGREAVIGYFFLRQEIAGGAIRVVNGGEACHEEALVQLADVRPPLKAPGGRVADGSRLPGRGGQDRGGSGYGRSASTTSTATGSG
jgi:hypothetical protein